MQQAIVELEIDNVSVETARVEDLWPQSAQDASSNIDPATQYDTVISRAFASLTDMIAKAGPLCRSGGMLLAMKGNTPEQELAEIPQQFELQESNELNVHGLDEQRTLIQLLKRHD